MKLSIVVALLLACGCSREPSRAEFWLTGIVTGQRPMTPQREARLVREGLKTVSAVSDFTNVYPNAIHRVLWAGGDWTWMSVAGLQQRYEIRMYFSMDLGPFAPVKPKGAVSVDILEVESFAMRGTLKVKSYSPNQRKLSDAEWTALRHAKGDIAAIGFPVITNAPVPNFEDAVRTR